MAEPHPALLLNMVSGRALNHAYLLPTVPCSEAAVFGGEHEFTIKNGLKASKTPLEIATTGPFGDLLGTVEERRVREHEAEDNKSKAPDGNAAALLDLAADCLSLSDVVTSAAITADAKSELPGYWQMAETRVDTFVTLIQEAGDSASNLASKIEGTVLKDLRGDPGNSYAIFLYDRKQSGQSSSTPHLRLPPLRTAHIKLAVAAFCRARGNQFALTPGDLFLIMDGGSGSDGGLSSCFAQEDGKTMKKEKHKMYAIFDEASLLTRRDVKRAVPDQLETLSVFSDSTLKLPMKSRKHYKGSNMGNVIGPVVLPRWDGQWRVTQDVKRLILGASGKILVGGAVPQATVQDSCAIVPALPDKAKYEPPKWADTQEPVCWHGMSEEFYEDLFMGLCGKGALAN